MEAYYYNHLTKQQQSAYHAMKTGLQSLSPSFSVPMLEPKVIDSYIEVLESELLLATGCTGKPAEVPFMMDYLQTGLPMLCLGDSALTLCTTLGGELAPAEDSSIAFVAFDGEDSLFSGVEDGERFLPQQRAMLIAADQGDACAAAGEDVIGIRVRQRDVWGLALPLERNDPATAQILSNFASEKCGCTPWWTFPAFVERATEEIRTAADGGDALCALSGGVDSTVCALLGHLALGPQLHCIFVDTGLLREGEADEVMEICRQQLGLKVRRIDARAECLLALKAVTDPGEKERIISSLLRDVLRREAENIPGVKLILRGTNYADTPIAEDTACLPGGVSALAPVQELFKDEIRQLGESLGMTPAMTSRQPFPGSGLASRIMGDVTPEKLAIVREADAIFRYEITENNQAKRLWQYFAALADDPDPDGGYVVTLRAVQAVDGSGDMAARLPNDLLERVTLEILQRCPQARRVMFDLTPSKSYTPMDTL